jgi:hypothetical protein
MLRLTRRQTLLDLISLTGILQDERVEVSLASDLELDLVRRLALVDDGSSLHAGGYDNGSATRLHLAPVVKFL